jgi:hypothetical protein
MLVLHLAIEWHKHSHHFTKRTLDVHTHKSQFNQVQYGAYDG